MRFLLATISCLLLLSSMLSAQETRFDVWVEEDRYDFTEGEPFTVVTADGDTITLTIRRKSHLHFEKYGIAFDYHNEMEVSEDSDVGITTITLNSTKSPVVLIQIYTIQATPQQIEDALMESFQKEFQSREATFLEESGAEVTRTFSGIARKGKKLDLSLAKQEVRLEIFTYRQNQNVLAIVLQHDMEDTELAKEYFSVIERTLK